MNTFMPYPDFKESAKCLDSKRLGKQRVEAYQIYLALTEENYGWKNHPAVKMWKGYERGLCWYGQEICNEWIFRGYRDTLKSKFDLILRELPIEEIKSGEMWIWYRYKYIPSWVFDAQLNLSHKSNLLRKNFEHYRIFFGGGISKDLPYVWPV